MRSEPGCLGEELNSQYQDPDVGVSLEHTRKQRRWVWLRRREEAGLSKAQVG